MKKILLICIPLLVLLAGCNKAPVKEEKNPQDNVIEDQTIGNLSFESFNMVTDENNITHIYFEIMNNGTTTIDISKVKFTLYQDDTEIVTLSKNISSSIEAGNFEIVRTQVDVDLDNVNRVEYSID